MFCQYTADTKILERAIKQAEQAIKQMKLGTLDVRCPKCGSRCFAKHSDPSFTRYYCERRGCDGSKKVSRTFQRLEVSTNNGKA